MSDLISRQEAIDAAIEAVDEWDGGYNLSRADMIEKAINNLPSAQPEIIRCKDCKYFDLLTEDFDYNFCDAWAGGTNENMFCGFAERRQDADSSGNMSGTQKALKCTETHSCDCERTETHDLVSRQAAIDAVRTYYAEEYALTDSIEELIEKLPSVQPDFLWKLAYEKGKRDAQPKMTRGKWIGGELGRCSVCGHEGNASDIWNGCKGMFCPNCGADMRGTE